VIRNCRIKEALKSADDARKYNDTRLKRAYGVVDYPDEARPICGFVMLIFTSQLLYIMERIYDSD